MNQKEMKNAVTAYISFQEKHKMLMVNVKLYKAVSALEAGVPHLLQNHNCVTKK